MRFIRLLMVAALIPSASCAVNRRPHTTVAALQADAATLRVADRALRDSVIERLVRRAVRRGDNTLDLLFLSGGGSNGAYGVGFLRGWRSRTDTPMPSFDLITGVSTGSLQSPFTLLATDASMDTLAELYRNSVDRVAPSIDWLFWLRRTGGLVNTRKYDRTIQQTINGSFSRELQAAFRQDRQILLTTADMDLGVGRIWSLGDVLDTTPAALTRTRALLKAATAIPGIFPPVVLDKHVHADGGIVANVLAPFTVEDFERLSARLHERGLNNVTVRMWTVMNLWLLPPVKEIPASSRRAINARTTAMLFYTHQPETIRNMQLLARASSNLANGMRVEFRYTAIPQSLAAEPAASKLFDRAFIQLLEKTGMEKGRGPAPWDSLPSAWVRPPR